MKLPGPFSLKRHLLLAAGLLLGVCVFVVVRNWPTFALMYDNAVAMTEGREVIEELRRPEDLLGYIASHPENASLVTYEVGARDNGIFYQPEVQRPLASTPHLLLLAEYAHQAQLGQLDTSRTVPLDSLSLFSLPGISRSRHEQIKAHWRAENLLRADSTVRIRHVVEAIAEFGDGVAADWLITTLGRNRTNALAEKWGLGNSTPPLPSSGMYLSWRKSPPQRDSLGPAPTYRTMRREAYADHVYELTSTLRRDRSFRRQTREHLRRQGSGLGVREQRTLARVTYPRGTAADYADLVAGSLDGTLGSKRAAAFLREQIEIPAQTDSVTDGGRILGTHIGSVPGMISVVGYIRFGADRPPRVLALFLEDLPIGVFYHLVQTSLDKGFLLRVLSDSSFHEEVRARLSAGTDSLGQDSY